MPTFVDTSALYSLLDADDANHRQAGRWFSRWAATGTGVLLTHSYAVVETAALVQRRLGHTATRALFGDLLPVLSVHFVDEPLHRLAESAYLAAPDGPSLVDCVSFHVMRMRGLSEAFAFDAHFKRQGLRTVP